MSDEQVWNDDNRLELRKELSSTVMGQLRLAKLGREEIVEYCRDYIEDVCPDTEQDEFMYFVADEIKRGVVLLRAESATWPKETDCDRLDRAESKLREAGIMLWQASPCCDTCTGAELPDRIDVVDSRFPGFRERVRGYAFFIDQNLPESLAESTQVSVYLGYGWFSPDDSEVEKDAYVANALGIANEVCASLRSEGFEINWAGDFSKKIGVCLTWQRRSTLE